MSPIFDRPIMSDNWTTFPLRCLGDSWDISVAPNEFLLSEMTNETSAS